ncbi:unnamed protein product [Lactuca virosa]|uniref:Uncharacterized protein n=1 Tax=Lactuca virosa TaxID=75947 RepID=A0AAU9MAD2_9ASTR|nr:unnamed protein product [Lactuca virosa]
MQISIVYQPFLDRSWNILCNMTNQGSLTVSMLQMTMGFGEIWTLMAGKMNFNNLKVPGKPDGSAASALLKFQAIVGKNDCQ